MMMRRNFGYLDLVILVCVALNMGVIRKQEDAVLKTQTDPISYNDKMEEIKDGEKGPPLPSIKRYKKTDFQVKSPVGEEAEFEERQDRLPGPGDVIPEDLTGLEKEEEFDEWWTEEWEDGDQDFKAGKSSEDVWDDTWEDDWKDKW